MRNPIVRVKNFVSAHKAPIALATGIYIGVVVTNNANEWKKLLDETDETATAA